MATRDSDVSDVLDLIAGAAPVLRRALWMYYPTDEANPIPERYLTVYLSHVFLGAGLFVYPEAWLTENDSGSRLDFVVYDYVRDLTLAAECKMLNASEKAAAFAEDSRRLALYRPRRQRGDAIPKKKYHLLAGLAYGKGVRKLWEDAAISGTPFSAEGWGDLADELQTFPVRTVVQVVSRGQDDYDLYLLAALRGA
jgi:hypothetical protein